MPGTIGILTGGGDAPGLNAVIRAVVTTAIGQYGMRVIGIEHGFEGLLGETQTHELTTADVRGLLPRGGTILGTRNRGRFVDRDSNGRAIRVDALYHEATENLRRLGIDALVVLGGEGTLAIAQEFGRLGIPVVGVPKTIDNDLACTELTFGFITALDIATDALDRLHTTAESHDRVMILEVMGRNTGWIALHSGIAGGADVILIPEIPFTMQSVADRIRARDEAGSNFSIIVAAEGAIETGHDLIYQDTGDPLHAPRLGGIGSYCQRNLEALTGKETRTVVLGHLQRGGRPNAFDRMLATNYGTCAVRAVVEGKQSVMVALQAGDVITVPIYQAIANVKTVPPNGQLVRTARDTGISFGAPDEAQHHRPNSKSGETVSACG
ncbi:MAG: ATP-dependent phosphofructokinase / diphosphate-dependent phosphofructokinase [Pyrinomonadaceae bacterium]|jgi:6-phosphofructokinase 1|nr:ATP-dependent phosphofructokinase / diphosphate-dependent phosphofructokinase [Pyrinomonadaceae bacterium]